MASTDERAKRPGVFLCECGDDIAGEIDLAKLARETGALPGEPYVATAPYWCSASGRRRIAEAVVEEGLGAVVVAGCSPRTHGALIADAAAAGGMNRNRTTLVNLREHCARVNPGTRAAATTKAKRLVRMGIEKVGGALELEPVVGTVHRSAAVIGGGISGLTAARGLAARGIPVVLIEKEGELGGLLADVNRLFPSYRDAADYVAGLAEKVTADPRIDVRTGSRVTGMWGHPGEYHLTVESAGSDGEVTAGAVVLAAGAEALFPMGLYAYGENPKVVSQVEFEGMLRKGLGDVKRIVMIQCAGSRNAERPYCSRVCCTATVKNTITVLSTVPDAEITVLTRGFAQYVGDLDRARDAGVTFLRYDPDDPPAVGDETVEVHDVISSADVEIPFDLIVLATPLVPRPETAGLAEVLGLPLDDQGFVAEPHTKLRPATVSPQGIFVAGSVHWPSTVTECQSQAWSAASRAALLLERETIEREAMVAVVDELTCRGCGQCAEVCAQDAPSLSDGEDGIEISVIDSIRCVGCGVCVRVCPSTAITLSRMTPHQLTAMVEVATSR